jgi:hypothetical protein
VATTAIWKVSDNLKRVVEYAINPEKTKNKDYSDYKYQGLQNTVSYTTDEVKTHQQFYVSAINCEVNSITEQMINTKKQFNKEEGILAFHAYQSFHKKEATPEEAHQIGLELAKELWGDRFQVVVSTHLDTNNIHNHFVINSVSFVDGKRYYDNKETYKRMRTVSDALCKKYRMSVIDKPKQKGKHYAQWKAEQTGQPTWRSMIRKDVDACIEGSYTFGQFINKLKTLGYEVNTNRKHMTIKPPNKERPVRVRSLANDDSYTEEAIKDRILNKDKPIVRTVETSTIVMKLYCKGHYHKYMKKKIGGLRGLYFHYLYKMGVIPKSRPNPKNIHILLKDEIRKLDAYTKEATLLNVNKIETVEQLTTYKNDIMHRMNMLITKRKQLCNKLRRSTDKEAMKQEISFVSKEIFLLRKEVVSCKNIETRSISMKDTLKQIQQRKDDEHNEPWRGSRRPSR